MGGMRMLAVGAAAVLATVGAGASQALGDWGIEVDGAAWSGGVPWTGSPANLRWTVAPGVWEAMEVLSGGGRTLWVNSWFRPGPVTTRTWSSLPEGQYTLRVDQRVDYRCSGYMCSYGTVRHETTFAVDRTPPGTPTVVGAGDPVQSTEPIRWTPVGDGGAGLARYVLRVDSVQQAELAPGACAQECQAEVDPSLLADGPHTVDVLAIDAVGNEAITSGVTRTVADTPTVTLVGTPTFVVAGARVALRATGSVPNGGALAYAWDLDGDGTFEHDTGDQALATLTAQHSGTMRVRATAPGGGQAEAQASIEVRPAPPSGDPGVSIEGGARFTNDPEADLDISWPEGATTMRIAIDGGFAGTQWRPVAREARTTLDPTPGTRLPQTVYVRFKGPGVDARETYTDDIVLDTTAPVLQQATAVPAAVANAGARRNGLAITTRASDDLSGVARMEVRARVAAQAAAMQYAPTVRVRGQGARPMVRVLDGAGNASAWVRVRVARPRAR